ncbi:MAG: response regulator [Deltaproteobacteria bacterium]|nr:response regulator [Deltaproteobacteria bacterium]
MADGVRPYLILVVDDVVDNIEMLADFLADRGFSVTLAFDGKDAIERAIANAPDVIVMDLAMPKLDGLAATRVLKNDPRTSAIPVLLYTAHSGIELRTLARAAGCAAVVGKGATSALLAAVDDALSGHV